MNLIFWKVNRARQTEIRAPRTAGRRPTAQHRPAPATAAATQHRQPRPAGRNPPPPLVKSGKGPRPIGSKNREKTVKNRNPRAAAHALAYAGKGHVFHK